MDFSLFFIQFLNGLQLGVLLFLLASGLTLTFGIMDFVNLAHGAFYMVGAFICASLTFWTGSFVWGVLLAIPLVALVGLATELIVIRNLYPRDHLDHVLATFGLILVFDTLVQIIWGAEGISVPLPGWLDGQVTLPGDIVFPTFRLMIIVGGIGSMKGAFVAALLIGLIDTMGRSFLDDIFKIIMSTEAAETAAPAVSAMLIYIMMAIILAVRPQGLFPPKVR